MYKLKKIETDILNNKLKLLFINKICKIFLDFSKKNKPTLRVLFAFYNHNNFFIVYFIYLLKYCEDSISTR